MDHVEAWWVRVPGSVVILCEGGVREEWSRGGFGGEVEVGRGGMGWLEVFGERVAGDGVDDYFWFARVE